MENTLNTGSLATLKAGQTLLVNARKVKNNKIHLEFAEVIQGGSAPVNVLALLNKSDDRFSSNARRAWVTAEPADAEEYFNIDFGLSAGWYMSEKGEMLDLDVLNPTMEGVRCRILVQETTEGTEYQIDNLDKSAKRRGKDGEFITHQGSYIFSNTIVTLTDEVDTTDRHDFLEADTQAQEKAKSRIEGVSELSDMI